MDNIEAVSNDIKFYSEESASLSIISDLENQLEKTLTDINFQQKGMDVDMINISRIRVDIAQESFKGEKTSKVDSIVNNMEDASISLIDLLAKYKK